VHRLLWILLPAVLALGIAAGFVLDEREPSRRTVDTIYEGVVTVTAPRASRPGPVPSRFEANLEPRNVPLQELVPADADVIAAWYPKGAIAVTWRREARDGLHHVLGLAIWRRTQADWRRAYSRTTSRIYQLDVTPFDLGRDGRPDFFVREDTDGSAGCGMHRVLSSTNRGIRQLYVRHHCMDEGTIGVRRDLLVEVDGIEHVGPGIHCCYRFALKRMKRWDGRRWVTVSRRMRPNRGAWPPS
jgi:hypothetical protein